ncbi:hypothetical protein ZYGR_0I03820 [Zygosaccharomyces rouxii]|uniref:ZYRO0C09130p n=2 Tax=Zygosaccharomyces rouxii TaxID=4956 RepID=C5DTJ8_ZYGRC|nr:uncharacterized protein ZYRO0C09130g [Zygosaccharomyces rouxii]KAH9201712.1 hypothetical protein LQ764DRAFT_227162 [Zygosaccharomyces rouxii]GAV48085.1 hypothetical protein ZYGR_0I03820 [Zygosaccharomyces rouxii]CAR27109.1 ZYRO0C09130p [Zygosaccharomyces rouxii]
MGTCCCFAVSDIILYIVAFFFPPVAVVFRSGCCSKDLLLNVLLTLLAFIPGMIHAFYYVTITSPARSENNRYFYQQGWGDRERYAGVAIVHDGETSVHRPEHPGYGSIDALLVQGRPNDNSGESKVPGPPPPYTELP